MAGLPPLNALKCFEAAARVNSFSRAADELHVTQSAVSHRIRPLEEWFGVALFDRQGRQTLPTPEGVELAASMAEAFGFEDVDLAISYGDWDDGPAHATKFLECVSVPSCNPAYLNQMGPFEKPADLVKCCLLHDLDRRPWSRWFKAAGVKLDDPQPGPLFEGFNLLHSAMLASQGVGLAPTAILADDLKSGRLIRLFETEVLHEKAYYIS